MEHCHFTVKGAIFRDELGKLRPRVQDPHQLAFSDTSVFSPMINPYIHTPLLLVAVYSIADRQ
jgi:hypothetical protein